jgi:hypothetical protein
VRPSSFVCRASAGTCDIAETCDGTTTACPVDQTSPDSDGDTVCDLIDNCASVANASQSDADGDDLGDACDACTNGAAATKRRIVLQKILAPTGDDKLTFSGTVTLPTTPTINPVVKGMGVILTTAAPTTLLEIDVPGGAYSNATKKGWRANPTGTRWSYKNGSPTTADPILGITLSTSPRTPGVFKFKVRAKNGAFPATPADAPLRATVIVDTPFASTGQCAEVFFPSASSCKFNPSQSSVSCK